MARLPILVSFILLLQVLNPSLADWQYFDVYRLEGSYSDCLLLTVTSDNAQTDRYEMKISNDGSEYFTLCKAVGDIVQLPQNCRDETSGSKYECKDAGSIFQVKQLDYETHQKYNISVFAHDVEDKNTEEPASFMVVVIDQNDEVPTFVQKSLSGSVEEAHEIGPQSEPFMTIVATDADSGTNAKIVYSIKEDVAGTLDFASGTRFQIDPNSGAVRLSKTAVLDYETMPELAFTVIASDNGGADPNNDVEAIVKVTVKDSNDHAPVFHPVPEPFSVPETINLNKPIRDIYAIDADEGVNKKVYFAIGGGNTGGVFKILSEPSSIGQSVGKLQLDKKLDFESGITTYKLEVVAFNKEASNHADVTYFTTTTINITVVDMNEPPIFRNTPYSTTITEGPLGYGGKPKPLVTVFAEDLDFKRNQTVSYSLKNPENWFTIDSNSGLVSLVAEVDREAESVVDGKYYLRVVASDNYDHGPSASSEEVVEVIIRDINDNPPTPNWGQDSKEVEVCEDPITPTVTIITASDPDSFENGPEFTFRFNDSVDTNRWGFERVSNMSNKVVAKFSHYGLSTVSEVVILPFTISDSGVIPQSSTATLIVTICKCSGGDNQRCDPQMRAGSVVIPVIIAIAAIMLLIVIVLAAIACKRHQAAVTTKGPLTYDEDDVRETIQVYQEEGGEQDQDAYDLSVLRAPLMADPRRPVEKTIPFQCAPRQNHVNVCDDLADVIANAKDQADNDPCAPPFDALLIFDYEGCGSDAGSLSSINTATTDGSMDYDYLDDWGPKFKRLTDMYNDGSDSE